MLNINKYDIYSSNKYETYIAKNKDELNIRFSRLWNTVEISFDRDFERVITIGANLLNDILETREDVKLK